ncbi:MAG: hypothetical protein KME07_12460 [Pegethrix bostrychoides GSE-TBD4-15B]|jgi:hypothetical protein|uniref:Uncharacterized protein n=1 Tax=Pegethrix bostrychoides GSE-TBD4-15B TaxID=2839662 RepID=A0A951U661_9CYAN|nr:hypothetical protein [Pegethrix bostrychoides GSE-TBD4-15B]
MRAVLDRIKQRKEEFAQIPLIQFMQDQSIDPRQRLAWAPCLAPFAMNFKDFNRQVLYQEPASSKIQQLLNEHSQEDGRHWVWFLQDLKLLGFDQMFSYTDMLRFLWGEETRKTRRLCIDLFGMCAFEENPLMKLVVVEALEATGNVALYETAQVAKALKEITHQHHPYFSASHYAVESGHIQAEMTHSEIEEFLEQIELTEADQRKAFLLVDRVFAAFTESMDEMLTFAQTHSYDQVLVTRKYQREKVAA